MGSTSPHEAIAVMDRNSDGSLSLAELGGSAQAFSPSLTEAQVQFAFKGLDADGDGAVSTQEFTEALQTGQFMGGAAAPMTVKHFVEGMKGFYKSPQVAFRALDTDHDEFLSIREFVGCTGVFSPPLSKEQAEFAFHGFDADQDGKVHIKEFLGVLRDGAFHESSMPMPMPVQIESPAAPKRITMADFKQRMGAVTAEGAFRALDKTHDGFVGKAEFMESSKAFVPPLTSPEADFAFNGLDADGDGKLCLGEFRGALKIGDFSQSPAALRAAGFSLDGDASPPPPPPPAKKSASVRDFVRHMGSSYEWPRDAFAALDSNKDGCAGREEFLSGANSFASPLGKEAAQAAFQGFDADDDGKVCFAEFMEALRSGSFEQEREDSDAVEITVAELKRHMGAVTPREAFGEMDKSKDGTVDFQEFQSCAKLFSPPLTHAQAARAFKRLDSDGDGKVHADQFIAVLELNRFPPEGKAAPTPPPATTTTKPPGSELTVAEFAKRLGPPDETLQEAFDKLDKDRDGSIAKKEFAESTGKLGKPLNAEQQTQVFQGLDANGDGAVSTSEFLGTLRSGHFATPGLVVAEVPEPTGEKVLTMKEFEMRMSGEGGGFHYTSPEDAFNSSDVNGDGELQLNEFVAGTRKFHPPLSEREAAWSFRGMDANGDGRLRPTEFFGALHSGEFKAFSLKNKTSRGDYTPTTQLHVDGAVKCSGGPENWSTPQQRRICCAHEPPGTCEAVAAKQAAAHAKEEKPEQHVRQQQLPGQPVTLATFAKQASAAFPSPSAMFTMMDADHDGLTSLAEFARATATFLPPLSREDTAWAFKGLDADNDQKLAAGEFVPVLDAVTSAKNMPLGSIPTSDSSDDGERSRREIYFQARALEWAGSVRSACARLDVEGNGQISGDEFLAGVQAFSPPPTEADARALFATLDADHDGRLSLEECQLQKTSSSDAVDDSPLLKTDLGDLAKGLRSFGEPEAALKKADDDGDGMLSYREFLIMGASVLKKESNEEPTTAALTAMMERLDLNRDNYIDSLELGAASSSPKRVSHDHKESEAYKNVPALVEGRVEVAFDVDERHTEAAQRPMEADEEREIRRQVQLAVAGTLAEELGLEVKVASAQWHISFPRSMRRQSALLLWTAKAADGGELQGRLEGAKELLRHLEEALGEYEQLRERRLKPVAWLQTTLRYYGPRAAGLRARLSQTLGRRPEWAVPLNA